MSEHLNHALIKVFMDSRENYEKYSGFVKTSLLSEHEKELFYSLKGYYNEFRDRTSADISDYFMWFSHVRCPDLDDIQLSQYRLILSRVEDVHPGSTKSVIKKFQESQFKGNLKQYLEVGNDPDKVAKICDDYKKESVLLEDPEKLYTDMDFTNIFSEEVTHGIYSWRLDFLNRALGKLQNGTLGIVYAYPDAGKSSFLASEMTHMASQLTGTQSIIWLNNEQDERKIAQRIVCAALNSDSTTIMKYKERAEKKYKEICGGFNDRIKVINARSFGLRDIKKTFEMYRPAVVVIDQIDNVRIKDRNNRAYELEKLYAEIRNLSVDYNCPIIGVCQASANVKWSDKEGNTHTKQYLDLSDMYFSNIGKQGAMDYAIGIGFDPDIPDTRFLSLTKSKQTKAGSKGTVCFDGAKARYEDLNI